MCRCRIKLPRAVFCDDDRTEYRFSTRGPVISVTGPGVYTELRYESTERHPSPTDPPETTRPRPRRIPTPRWPESVTIGDNKVPIDILPDDLLRPRPPRIEISDLRIDWVFRPYQAPPGRHEVVYWCRPEEASEPEPAGKIEIEIEPRPVPDLRRRRRG